MSWRRQRRSAVAATSARPAQPSQVRSTPRSQHCLPPFELKWQPRLVPGNSVPFGFINANKQAGITSTAFGSRVRHALGRVPVGHWGTLDPDATGVLVLAVGQATKLLPLLGDGRKKYEFDIVLGVATETADASGAVTQTSALPDGCRD